MSIRRGCSRTVFLWRSWAVKFPSCRYGLTQFLLGWWSNRKERDAWGWSGGSEVLCPVLGCYLFGLVLVMRRANEIEEGELLPAELEPLRRAASDIHHGNVGRLDGRLVLVDYA